MAEREQKRKPAPARETEEVTEAPAVSEAGDKLKDGALDAFFFVGGAPAGATTTR